MPAVADVQASFQRLLDLYDAPAVRVRPHDQPGLDGATRHHPGCDRGRVVGFFRDRGVWVKYLPEGSAEPDAALVSAVEVLP